MTLLASATGVLWQMKLQLLRAWLNHNCSFSKQTMIWCIMVGWFMWQESRMLWLVLVCSDIYAQETKLWYINSHVICHNQHTHC